jgi:hypothetical protein
MKYATRTAKIQHYAYYNDDYGIARLVGGGYYFTPEVGESRLVSYKDVNLMLLGRIDLADTQHTDDLSAGGYAAIACSRSN